MSVSSEDSDINNSEDFDINNSENSDVNNLKMNSQEFRIWKQQWRNKEKKLSKANKYEQSYTYSKYCANNTQNGSNNNKFATCSNNQNVKIDITHLNYPVNFKYEIVKYKLRPTYCSSRQIKKTYGPFKCSTCLRCFSKKQQLYNHNRTHKKYSCAICKKILSRQSSYQQHMDRHFDFKRHVCTKCGKKYHLSSLSVHNCKIKS